MIQEVTVGLFCAIFVLSTVLSCLYAAPSVSLLTHLVSIGTWVLNFGLVLLVPMDVYLTAFNEGEEDSARKEQVAGWYLLMYWLVYLLTWTVVPVVQEWEDSGDLSSLDRLKRSLRSNGSFYLYMLVFGVVFLVAVFFLYPDLFNSKDLLKAMGYCYGMFVLMVLLSYSVLQLPAWLFRLSSPAAKLSLYRSYHSKAQEELQESIFGIQPVVATALQLKAQRVLAPQLQPYFQAIKQLVPQQIANRVKKYEQVMKDNQLQPVRDLEAAIALHRSIRRAKQRYERAVQAASQREADLRRVSQEVKSPGTLLQLRMVGIRVLAVILALMGVVLVVGQFQLYFGMEGNVIGVMTLSWGHTASVVANLLVLGYMSVMSFYGMFALKVSHWYGLYVRSSDGASLMFSTINFSRVSAPLVLNYLELLGLDRSVYITTMGKATQIGFVKAMPLALLLLIVCNYFELWSQLTRAIGLDGWGFDSYDSCTQDQHYTQLH